MAQQYNVIHHVIICMHIRISDCGTYLYRTQYKQVLNFSIIPFGPDDGAIDSHMYKCMYTFLVCNDQSLHWWYKMVYTIVIIVYRRAWYGLIQGLWRDKLGDTGSLPGELISRLPAIVTHLSVSKIQWDRTCWLRVSFGQSDQTGDTNCNRSCVAGRSFFECTQLAPIQRIV